MICDVLSPGCQRHIWASRYMYIHVPQVVRMFTTCTCMPLCVPGDAICVCVACAQQFTVIVFQIVFQIPISTARVHLQAAAASM